jgi:hypothetical protein
MHELHSVLMTKAMLSLSLVSCFKHSAMIIILLGLLFIVMILNLGNLFLQPSFSEMISYGNNGTADSIGLGQDSSQP